MIKDDHSAVKQGWKWTHETRDEMTEKLFERTELLFPEDKIEIFTNEHRLHLRPV